MAILNYSSHGRGASRGRGISGGRGRARGFHSSRPPSGRSGMSWVRGRGGRGASGRDGGRSNQWVRAKDENEKTEDDEAADSSTKALDVVQGGSRRDAGRPNRWVLQKNENQGAEEEGKKPSEKIVDTYQDVAAISVNEVTGLSNSRNDEIASAMVGSEADAEDSNGSEESNGDKDKDILDNVDHKADVSKSQAMERLGRNKLVLKSGSTGGKARRIGRKGRALKNDSREGKLRPISSDEKVSRGGQHSETDQDYPDTRTKAQHLSRKRPAYFRQKQGPQTRSQFHGGRPLAKRIRLTIPEANSSDDSGLVHDEPAESKLESQKLSDFAYHETGRMVSRFQNRTWKAGEASDSNIHQGPRKMGLVRAKHNSAPVCPTYATGVECTNRFCRKRHDIPKESTVPFCSFFQRHGQCLKEDCKFRHVKINPRATICPSFSLLGFCEDNSCTMKHSRLPSKASPEKARKPPAPKHHKYVRQG